MIQDSSPSFILALGCLGCSILLCPLMTFSRGGSHPQACSHALLKSAQGSKRRSRPKRRGNRPTSRRRRLVKPHVGPEWKQWQEKSRLLYGPSVLSVCPSVFLLFVFCLSPSSSPILFLSPTHPHCSGMKWTICKKSWEHGENNNRMPVKSRPGGIIL